MSKQDFLEKETAKSQGVGYQIRDESLSQLGVLASALVQVRNDVENLENELKNLREQERKISREEIPSLLLSNNLSMIKLDDGNQIEVVENLSVSLPKRDLEKRRKVLSWIADHGGIDIIRDEVVVEDPERELVDYLKSKKIPYERKPDIHHQSLKTFFKNKLGLTKGSLAEIELGEIPEEVNLYLYKETKIK